MQNRSLVFIGLGNPGKKYAGTRHNFGFLVVEALAQSLGLDLQESKFFEAKVAKGRYGTKDCQELVELHLLMPLTYMNESGKSVRRYLDYYKLATSEIVVVCDDTALKLGDLRLRSQGSSGGHNGLKSIAAHMGTEQYARLRMGIGSKMDQQSLADYVLDDFKADEISMLNESIKKGEGILKSLVSEPTRKPV